MTASANGYAYSNNGLSWRAVMQGWTLAAGEVFFASTPTTAQLESAFPDYSAAVAAATLSQQASAALSAGLEITSTGTPALNATYAVDNATATNITGILAANANSISVAAQIAEWPDITGTPHDFTWTNFANLVGAILAYRAQLQPLIAGAPGSLPSASAAIA